MKRAVTSASNIFRRKLCPGSGRMEAEFAEKDSEASSEGTMLHTLFLTGRRPDDLTSEQAQTLDMADFYAEEFFGNLRQRFGIPMEASFIDERDVSMVLHGPRREELFPGHADVIRTWPEYQVRGIVDAKFGFMEVEHAPDNLQIASYAGMRHQVSEAKAIGVCITQPRNFGPRMTQAGYTADRIPAAIVELARIFHDSEKPDAELIAGDKQCHFCKAKTVCDAYKAKFAAVQTVDVTAIQTVSDDDLERLHVAIAFANKISDDVREEMRQRIRAGRMPGWKLQNSGDEVTLNDVLGFYNALKEYMGEKLTPKRFDDCRDMVWGRLTDLVQRSLSLSEKKAKEALKEILAPFASRRQKAMKIVRDKSAVRALPDPGCSPGYVDGQE